MSALRLFLYAMPLAALPTFPLTAADAALPALASDAAPVPVLNWQPCTDPSQQGFDCATAQVPLDYSKPQGETISLAVIRHPAQDPAHRIGSLFWNPGGPGTAGTVELPLLLAPTTSAPVSFPIPVRERFDIISWDLRGSGASTAVLCWDKSSTDNNFKAEQSFLATLPLGVPSTPAERRSWIDGWAYIDKLCGANAGTLLEHVSMTESARDLDLLREAVGDKQLTYQGNSGGTFIGDVYANLFPNRFRAMMLLANINAVAWTHPDRQDPRLDNYLRQQADRGAADTLNGFLTLCGQASTAECAFSAGNAAATQQKWQILLQRVRRNPVTVGDEQWNYDKLVSNTFSELYQVPVWPGLACQLQQAWQEGVAACPAAPPVTTAADAAPPVTTADIAADPATPSGVVSQMSAIECAESPNPRNPAAYFGLAELAYARSGAAVGQWYVWTDEQCAAWPAIASDRYTGPWNQPTANPILLINNIADPATPYQDAVFMAHTLANARLLTVDGYGHASGGVPSTCVNEYLASYFIDGTLPPEGTVCQKDQQPFTTGP